MVAWSEETIQAVWERAMILNGFDPEIWRKDEWGAWISREKYGDRESRFGWEIVRISATGRHDLFNLRPVQWENIVGGGNGELMLDVPPCEGRSID